MARKAELTITVAQAKMLITQDVALQGATLHQTMGPNWREIIWIAGPFSKKPYISKTHTVRELKRLLNIR